LFDRLVQRPPRGALGLTDRFLSTFWRIWALIPTSVPGVRRRRISNGTLVPRPGVGWSKGIAAGWAATGRSWCGGARIRRTISLACTWRTDSSPVSRQGDSD